MRLTAEIDGVIVRKGEFTYMCQAQVDSEGYLIWRCGKCMKGVIPGAVRIDDECRVCRAKVVLIQERRGVIT